MPIGLDSLVILLVVGLVAGWLAGLITHGGGFGLVGNIIVGIVGAFIGFHLLQYLGVGMGHGTINAILTATFGAVILLFVIGLVRR